MSDLMELGRRAVACKGWRWTPGMLATCAAFRTARVLVVSDEPRPPDYVVMSSFRGDELRSITDTSVMGGFPTPADSRYPTWPDLSDPATLGCLLALVREAWEGKPDTAGPLAAFRFNGSWCVGAMEGGTLAACVLPAFDTEAEALVVALERAP